MLHGKKEKPAVLPVHVEEKITSIAVLPFDNLSDDQQQEFFCDGLADAVLNKLTNIGTLRVIARNSSFAFKGQYKDIRAIGDSLEVESILEGSVLKSGNKIRVTAQLIKVSDNAHILSRQYDYEIEDIFALQDSISIAIVTALEVELLDKEKAAIEKRYTDNVQAYTDYLQGRHHWGNRTREGTATALASYQKAIKEDPGFALAYAGIADVYNSQGFFGLMPPQTAFPKTKEMAMKALALDESLAEAHTSLGWAYLNFDWNWPAAEKEFRRALEIKPGYAIAHHWYADYLSTMGQFEQAILERKKALEYDPFSLMIRFALANGYRNRGRYEESLEECQKALAIDPNFGLIYGSMGFMYLEQNKMEEAFHALNKFKELYGESALYDIGICFYYAESGNRNEAEKIIRSLIDKKKTGTYVSSIFIAWGYLALNNVEASLDWLEKGYEEHDPMMPQHIKTHYFDPIRSHPRYKALLKKMNLPEE